MNMKHAVISTIAVMAVTTAGFAVAEDNANRNERGRTDVAQHEERGAGPNHQYHRGDRLPAEEHTSKYVVNDWHNRNLREPPAGYHWVRSGDDYVLAAIATGVIADLILHH